ncbi:cytochrome P450 [Streptomyces phyllanthi]|nr:cytochrome P450 [Streptomyces phyllanthi]
MRSALTGVRPAVPLAPGALPVIGHAPALVRDPLGFLTGVGYDADMVEIRLGPDPALLVCDPELTRQVLVHSRTFDKGGRIFDRIRQNAGDGLISSPWSVHRRHRPLVQPAFHPRRLPRYAEEMREEAAAMTGAWRSGSRIDVSSAMHEYAVRVLLRTLFSAASATHVLDDIRRCIPVMLRGAYQRAMNPVALLERLPTPGNRRFEAAVSLTKRHAAALIDEYQRSGTDHGDLLSMMLAARDERTGEGLTAREINDHVFTLLVAGTETTAALLGWTFHLLARHPEALERLHRELDALGDGPLGLDTLRGLGYTHRVLTETMRLYPASWMLTRITTEEHVLGGRRLPPGTTVVYSPYLIHRHPGVYTDPDRFDPDRWLPERAATVPRAAFIPFGAGARKCIGDEYGLAEATIALVTVARAWTLEPDDDRPVRPVPRIALAPGPLPMTVRARRPDAPRPVQG